MINGHDIEVHESEQAFVMNLIFLHFSNNEDHFLKLLT